VRVLVTGGLGYCGSVLVPKLMREHHVTIWDAHWFGNHIGVPSETVDITHELPSLRGFNAVIHLAAVANDPCGELDSKLTWEVNALATMRLADECARAGVKRFIYASSGSVYGVSNEPDVIESLRCDPISDYNKTKMVAERAVLSYSSAMSVCVVRPATVCGMSPRMRLDVAVNALTIRALTDGKITVFGGSQIRPNIHIDDLTDLYGYMLDHDECGGVYNAGFENMSIDEIAMAVKDICGGDIVRTESNDPRSYRLSSKRLVSQTPFRPKHTVRDAIFQMKRAFERGTLKDSENCYNLKAMPR